MPELPEVETIARALNSELANKSIINICVRDPKVLDANSTALLALVQSSKILGAYRRAKVLLLSLQASQGQVQDTKRLQNTQNLQELIVAFHLKMTGRLLPLPQSTEPNKHTRIFFELESSAGEKTRLFFDDMRRFGYCKFIEPHKLHTWSFWAKLGREPLEIKALEFAKCFEGRRGKIKALLLNQELVVGIGNIYADESLFQAGIKPDTLVQKLKTKDLERLHKALVEILNESIQACGSSIKDYRTAGGEPGAFQNKLKVYGQAGKPCPVCKNLLVKSKVASRSSVYCPICQR